MSRLKELNHVYIGQNTNIPVERYDGTGELVRGYIVRFSENDDLKVLVHPLDGHGILSNLVEGVLALHIPADHGAASNVWFLTPLARLAYANLINPEFSRYAALREKLCAVQFDSLSKVCPTVQCHHIVEWPGLCLMNVHGFISVNKPGEPVCGFLYHDNKEAMCMEFVSRIPDNAVLSKMGK